jgi:hypothetical protein
MKRSTLKNIMSSTSIPRPSPLPIPALAPGFAATPSLKHPCPDQTRRSPAGMTNPLSPCRHGTPLAAEMAQCEIMSAPSALTMAWKISSPISRKDASARNSIQIWRTASVPWHLPRTCRHTAIVSLPSITTTNRGIRALEIVTLHILASIRGPSRSTFVLQKSSPPSILSSSPLVVM